MLRNYTIIETNGDCPDDIRTFSNRQQARQMEVAVMDYEKAWNKLKRMIINTIKIKKEEGGWGSLQPEYEMLEIMGYMEEEE